MLQKYNFTANENKKNITWHKSVTAAGENIRQREIKTIIVCPIQNVRDIIFGQKKNIKNM